jgi:hypothetical protein
MPYVMLNMSNPIKNPFQEGLLEAVMALRVEVKQLE